MKFENSNTSTTRFSEQVNKVIELFQQWNDCERSVSLYAVLKRIPFSCTKFLQSVIDTNLTQAYCLEQTKLLEHNANSAAFVRSLCEAYKNFTVCTSAESLAGGGNGGGGGPMQLNKDSIFYESDRCCQRGGVPGGGGGGGGGGVGNRGSGSLTDILIADKYYDKKEDILNDILTLMPILTPGNDEAKCAYLEFIPMTVDDAIRGTVNTSLVQQIFSYLLIHPAFSTDDRRSVSKFLRHLEEHIVSTDPNFIIYTSGRPSPTSEAANSTTTASSTNWQAIAPPQSKSTETIISWDSQHHLTGGGGGGGGGNSSSHASSYVDIANVVVGANNNDILEYRKSLGNLIDFPVGPNPVVVSGPGATPKIGHLLYESASGGGGGGGVGVGTDDHHISFSKNGTEILDFDCDDTDKSNTQIGFDTLANLNEFLTVPGIIDNITMKTRRSNSLTTTGTLHSTACTSSSAQNLNCLAQQQKPRSFSLSMVSPRSSLTSSGSDTRLDDFKPNYAKFTPHNVGMSNIGQWLKSLRLHKYVWLFSNITYDQMLDITEEYLQNLNVTKGARHKLVGCIQKLKERHAVLVQLEKDIMQNLVAMPVALEELTSVVLTPMKPVEHFNKNDVGGQFLKVLNLVSTMMTTKPILLPQDEEPVNSLLWILEKAVHNEAFVAHTNQLKEHRFKVSRIKNQFPPKNHYGKNGNAAATSSTVSSATPSTTSSSSTGGSGGGGGGGGVGTVNTGSNNVVSGPTSNMTRSRSLLSFPSLQHLDTASDSDYQSLSSKSNSTESIDSIHHSFNIPPPSLSHARCYTTPTPTSSADDEGFDSYPFDQSAYVGSINFHLPPPPLHTAPSANELPKLPFYAPSMPMQSHQPVPTLTRPQLKDYINIPKLANLYGHQSHHSTKNDVAAIQQLKSNRPTIKISEFIQSNQGTVVDLLMIKPIFNRSLDPSDRPPQKTSQSPASLVAADEPSPLGLAETPELVQFYSDDLLSANNCTQKVRSPKFFSFPADDDTEKTPMDVAAAALRPSQSTEVCSGGSSSSSSSGSVSKEHLNTNQIQFGKVNFGESLEPIFKQMDHLPSTPQPFHSNEPNKKIPTRKEHAPVASTSSNIPTTASNSRNSTTFLVSSGIGSTCGGSSSRSLTTSVRAQLPPPPMPMAARANYAQVVAVGLGAGMTGIGAWLKSLRLHKYTWLFAEMNYEQMLQITDEYLEQLGITKGARNKLAICIMKLNQRYDTLDAIESGLLRGTCVTVSALDELSIVVQTPMKPAMPADDDSDVASKFLRVLNLVYDRMTGPLLVTPDEQTISKLVWILEKAMQNEGCTGHIGQLRKMRFRFGTDGRKFSR